MGFRVGSRPPTRESSLLLDSNSQCAADCSITTITLHCIAVRAHYPTESPHACPTHTFECNHDSDSSAYLKGEATREDDEEEDAEAPQVDLAAVLLATEYFRRNVRLGSALRLQAVNAQGARKAQVCARTQCATAATGNHNDNPNKKDTQLQQAQERRAASHTSRPHQ
jgi:hypothetical protein